MDDFKYESDKDYDKYIYDNGNGDYITDHEYRLEEKSLLCTVSGEG